ncbi:Beta-carbonic anhydrase 1 [Hyphodiscus hymeniophilus]|uniref:Carbonic anhydrase n=1 Tax=Hyphodiscus hymeniophilus TaxID=353542 RepID=A0A9P7AXL6_9HELO|nr:Beta-carbonic anhydrase 1 [Hyphodiscus hymeniophilus]
MKAKEMGKTATAIISCSDPRIVPEQFLGLEFSECAIIRNAGGRTQDAMRSILALDAVGGLGTVVVIHHTDCGMSHTDEAGFEAATKSRHPALAEPGYVYGAIADPEKTILEDVKFLKSQPGLTDHINIFGLVLDTHTGVLKQAALHSLVLILAQRKHFRLPFNSSFHLVPKERDIAHDLLIFTHTTKYVNQLAATPESMSSGAGTARASDSDP